MKLKRTSISEFNKGGHSVLETTKMMNTASLNLLSVSLIRDGISILIILDSRILILV
jgi:hypothetical protein